VQTRRDRRAARWHSRRSVGLLTAATIAVTTVLVLRVIGDQHDGVASREPLARRATLHALPGARLVRTGSAPNETVRLYSGKVMFDVPPLAPRHSFRVVTGDAEVRVHGTTFEVEAEDDRLLRVQVINGVVEVRLLGEQPIRLETHDRWRRPETPMVTTAPSRRAIAKADPRPSRAHPAPLPDPQTKGETPPPRGSEVRLDEEAFNRGWAELRDARYGEAADAFAESLAAEPDGAIAPDALFWRAVALEHAGNTRAAIDAFRERPARSTNGDGRQMAQAS
jgi:hypothetical protein